MRFDLQSYYNFTLTVTNPLFPIVFALYPEYFQSLYYIKVLLTGDQLLYC